MRVFRYANCLLLAALLLCSLASPALAEGDPVGDIVLAEKLADYGLEHQDSEALILACKIYVRYPSSDFTGKGLEEPDDDTTSARGPEAEKQELYQAEELLEHARNWTKDPHLLTRIETLNEELESAGRSPRSGILRGSEAVRSRHRWSTKVEFIGEEEARVEVLGQDNSKLQVVVYDDQGEWIAGNEAADQNCSLHWKVARDGLFKVVIRNRGAESSAFRFVMR